MIQALTVSQLSLQAYQYLKQTEQPQQPKYFCFSCNHLKPDNHCDCFQRHVLTDYNRCFNHSKYNPIAAIFQAPANLEEIIKEEEEEERQIA